MDLRWYKKEEFATLNKHQKDELRAWQTTVEGKNTTKQHRDAYFREKGDGKRKREDSDSSNSRTKKLQRQVAALQQQVDENTHLAAIASVLKEGSFFQLGMLGPVL